jgi:hypothetical protein
VQKVPLARRFALLPLGPPSLRYTSVCKAMIKHSDETQEVILETDRSYKKGMVCWFVSLRHGLDVAVFAWQSDIFACLPCVAERNAVSGG